MSAMTPLKASKIRPLQDKRIVITRPREQADEFAALLKAYGAKVFLMPTIRIDGPEDWTEVDQAIERLDEYNWVVFTSSNGVEYFCRRLNDGPLRSKICTVGPATAKALSRFGLHVDLVPEQFTGEGVLAAFPKRLDGARWLAPRGNLARDTILEGLRQRGAVVDEIVVYYTRTVDRLDPQMVQRLQSGSIDIVTFTSSSTAKNFIRLLGESEIERAGDRFLVASIGPQTSRTLRELGLNVNIEASAATVPAMVEAIAAYFHSSRR